MKLPSIAQKFVDFYTTKNRWWIPLITGAFFSLCLPPFNHETHWVFAPFPFFSFFVLIPIFGFVIQKPLKRAIFHTFLFGTMAALGQFYWISFVTAEGLWHLILLGTALAACVIGLFYLVAALFFRLIHTYLPRAYIFVFPAVWVLVDYGRSIGELSFPWAFLGYSFTPILPLSQIASITGVWGLTFIVVLGNTLLWDLLQSACCKKELKGNLVGIGSLGIFLVVVAVWGGFRLRTPLDPTKSVPVVCLQPNLDQFNWSNTSLEESFEVTESMIKQVASDKPELIVMPESALLSYIMRKTSQRRRVQSWYDSTKIPMIFGGLHWDKAPSGSIYDYLVYNTAFLVDDHSGEFDMYYKIKLVPFSEAVPFEANIPILSRVNLGEADFKRGKDHTVFSIGRIKAAPYICYEIIYPRFVQRRLGDTTNMLVNVTNDGWFGRSTGPYQHAMMSRMRSIENGISLVRCANSGITMTVDPFGRLMKRTNLYEHVILEDKISIDRKPTIYSRWGDWFISFSVITVLGGIAMVLVRRLRKQ